MIKLNLKEALDKGGKELLFKTLSEKLTSREACEKAYKELWDLAVDKCSNSAEINEQSYYSGQPEVDSDSILKVKQLI